MLGPHPGHGGGVEAAIDLQCPMFHPPSISRVPTCTHLPMDSGEGASTTLELDPLLTMQNLGLHSGWDHAGQSGSSRERVILC